MSINPLKVFVTALVLLGSVSVQATPVVDAELVPFVRQARPTDKVKVIALMEMERGLHYPNRYDSRAVLRFLKARAQRSLEHVRRSVALVSGADQIKVLKYHWVNNSFVAEVTPASLRALAQIPQVERIYLDRKVTIDYPVRRAPVDFRADRDILTGDGWQYGLEDMGLDQLYAASPDIDGRGVIVGSIDTGVDGSHPALAGKVHSFYDASTKQTGTPRDFDRHGTHTIGTMIGGDRQNIKIGVAPGAKVMAVAGLNSYANVLESMEWILDPDKNSNTLDFPRVINNSWNSQNGPDVELFYRAISAWEAVGILPVFSAGNAGPGDMTITKPHEHPAVFVVAASGPGGAIASFSSRGPAKYRDQITQKPDVSAPGVDVISTVPGGRLEKLSGTSMAAPHVTGTVALLLQINPKLNPQQLREILVKSSRFVDVNGNTVEKQVWSKTYGFGRSSAFNAAKTVFMGLRTSMLDFTNSIINQIEIKPSPVLNQSKKMTDKDFGRELDPANSKWVKANQIWADL